MKTYTGDLRVDLAGTDAGSCLIEVPYMIDVADSPSRLMLTSRRLRDGPLTPKDTKLLRTMPDLQFAERLGRTLFAVQTRRLKLGIAPAANPEHRPWTEEELRLLGTPPDADVARKIGRPHSTALSKGNALKVPYAHPRYVSWKLDELELLAKLSDEDVAEQTGRSLSSVRQKRW